MRTMYKPRRELSKMSRNLIYILVLRSRAIMPNGISIG